MQKEWNDHKALTLGTENNIKTLTLGTENNIRTLTLGTEIEASNHWSLPTTLRATNHRIAKSEREEQKGDERKQRIRDDRWDSPGNDTYELWLLEKS